ncbi:MAG: hypothetical protein HFG26_02065 [Provencibacterium sp.]|jgi:hypothetical protein|nr:hypothetical protein [Provencibacterium sp.]
MDCKRCLLEELSRQAFQNIYAYIDSIPEEQKVPKKVYRERLEKCKSCSQLIQGMCSLCGCFVEVRAAKKRSDCPNIPKNWERYIDGENPAS